MGALLQIGMETRIRTVSNCVTVLVFLCQLNGILLKFFPCSRRRLRIQSHLSKMIFIPKEFYRICSYWKSI